MWAAVEKADKEGVAVWRQTHGCDGCFPKGTRDEWGNEIQAGALGGPIDPDCAQCSGDGVIL